MTDKNQELFTFRELVQPVVMAASILLIFADFRVVFVRYSISCSERYPGLFLNAPSTFFLTFIYKHEFLTIGTLFGLWYL